MPHISLNRIFAIFFITVMLITNTGRSIIYAYSEGEFDGTLYASSAVLMDADSGRVLYEKNGYEAMANASTTKILTCIIALEMGDMDSIATASALAASQPRVRLGMREGQQFYLEDLLYALMLESYNDCAVVIAEHIAVSVEAFADLMNEKAIEIGCEDTYFITPNGLDASDENGSHHTTAADLARIMRYCITLSGKSEEFLAITGTSQYYFSDISGTYSYSLYNRNAYLSMMDGAFSGKTGFTGAAGYCYVGAVNRDGKKYIVSLLACGWPNNKNYKWSDCTKLFEYGIDSYELFDLNDIAADESELPAIEVEGAQGGAIGESVYASLELRLDKDIYGGNADKMLILPDETPYSTVRIDDDLAAPLLAGTCVGAVSYIVSGNTFREYGIYISEDIYKIDYKWSLRMVYSLMML